MKVIDKTKRQRRDMPITSIPVGQVFKGEMAKYGRSTFLRHYSGVVDLENPRKTWSGEPRLTVYNYTPVRAHIVIEGLEEDHRACV